MAVLSFDERFGLLIDAEWLARENRRLVRVLQEAKLSRASLWVHEHLKVFSGGATGVGKSSWRRRSDRDAPISSIAMKRSD